MEKQLIPKIKAVPISIERMFELQENFQARFYNFDRMTEQELVEYKRLMLTCISVEAMEALDWLNWKPWKKTKIPFNRYEFLNELVDIQHFLINAAIAVGCTSGEFSALFNNKHHENIKRQERSY